MVTTRTLSPRLTQTATVYRLQGLATLMRQALTGADLRPLGQTMLQCAADDPQESHALLDAAILFEFMGQPELAARLQGEALRLRRHYRLAPARQPQRLRLLALMAPGPIMGNVPIECLLEHSDIELTLYYASEDVPDPGDLPEHDLLFVAIAESDANRALLEHWTPHLINWPRPVLNDPRRILRLSRDSAWQQLQNLPGVVMPMTWRLSREQVEALAQGVRSEDLPPYPVLIRPLDSHAGHGLARIEDVGQLAAFLEQHASEAFFLSPFVDYRDAEGRFRKIRVMLVDGQPFVVHMAISDHWMIHYLNAEMDASAWKREAEAEFMQQFDAGFAARHADALVAIHAATGLDYVGIDCAELPDGQLLIFEIDPAMVVHDMDPVDRYPYKPPAMQRIFAAFRALLLSAAERGPGLRSLPDEQ